LLHQQHVAVDRHCMWSAEIVALHLTSGRPRCNKAAVIRHSTSCFSQQIGPSCNSTFRKRYFCNPTDELSKTAFVEQISFFLQHNFEPPCSSLN